jgi:hypothetical protein
MCWLFQFEEAGSAVSTGGILIAAGQPAAFIRLFFFNGGSDRGVIWFLVKHTSVF